MGSQYREYCCFCIPQRFVVFVLSTIYLLASIGVAGFSWFVLSQTTDNVGSISLEVFHNSNFNGIVLDSTQRTILYVLAGVYTASVVISLLGLIGAIRRKRRLVQIFFYMLLLQLLVSMGAGIYYLYEIFKIDPCIDFDQYIDGIDFGAPCNSSIKSLRIGTCISFAITWLFQIWMLHSVHEYVTQLRNETAYESVPYVGQAAVPMLGRPSGDAFHYNEQPYDPYGNKQPATSQYAFSTPYTANVHNHA